MCPSMENLDLVYQPPGNAKSPTHSRPSECDSGQVIQAGSNHPDRMVAPSGSFSKTVPKMAPAPDRPICHEVQPQVTSICVSGTGLPSCSGGCSHSHLGRSGCIRIPTDRHIGQSGGEIAGFPVQETHSDCTGLAQHALVLRSSDHASQIPLSLPNITNLLTQPFNQIPHRNLTNLNLHAWLLEPQQSRSRASLRQWLQELRLLKEDPPDQSMRQSGPFLQSGASLIRWTSGHHL